MVYECDKCSAALPAGVNACPHCGEQFDDAVPVDAVLPKTGFRAGQPEQTAMALYSEQPPVLESEVMTLRSHVAKLTCTVMMLEGQTAAQTSQIMALVHHLAAQDSHITTLTNRLTVAEMAGRENKRRFVDHVRQVKEVLSYFQVNGTTGTVGQ